MKNIIKSTKLIGIVLSVFLVITVVSEVFLLKQNLAMKERLREIRKRAHLESNVAMKLEKQILEESLTGQCLPFLSHNENQPFGIGEIESKHVILFCFSATDCGTCLQNEFETWTSFYESCDTKQCRLIGITAKNQAWSLEELQSSFQINFPVVEVSDFNLVLAGYELPSTPVVFFGNMENKKILFTFLATINNKSNDRFLNKVQTYLNRCNEHF